MFRKTVNYIDFENGEEVEKEEVLRFAFTPPSIRLFESATGEVFFESYNKAFSKLGTIIGGGLDLANMDESQALEFMPILTDPTINDFLMSFIPCLYAKVENDKLAQNELTVEEAEESMWLMELVNIEFFLSVFNEISGKQLQDRKKPTSKKKAKKA